MYESCTFYPKLYKVDVNIWIESSDNLVEKKGIGSDHSFELLDGFYVCSPILKVCLNTQKNQDFLQSQAQP